MNCMVQVAIRVNGPNVPFTSAPRVMRSDINSKEPLSIAHCILNYYLFDQLSQGVMEVEGNKGITNPQRRVITPCYVMDTCQSTM